MSKYDMTAGVPDILALSNHLLGPVNGAQLLAHGSELVN
jgi:hypothetical protein